MAYPPGIPGSAGTRDKAVERIEEGLASTASGNAEVRNQFDAGLATGREKPKPRATIDTSGTSYQDRNADIKRGQPNVW